MGQIKYLYIKQNITDGKYREEHNINVGNLYPTLLLGAKVVYSTRYLTFYNMRTMEVFLYDFSEIREFLEQDKHFVDYLNIPNVGELINVMDVEGEFNRDIIEVLFSRTAVMDIDVEGVSDSYILNHYMKLAERIQLKKIMDNEETANSLDPLDYFRTLIDTGLDISLYYIYYKGKKHLWAYFNAREEGGFYYPVLHIADFKIFSETGKVVYNKYYAPIEVLKQLMGYNTAVELSATDADFKRTVALCGKCKFNVTSPLHESMCEVLYGKKENKYHLSDDI